MHASLRSVDQRRSRATTIALIAGPVLLWAAFFAVLLRPERMVYRDGLNHFRYVQFFVENIARGDYPAWDPYDAWGRSNALSLRTINDLNPVWLIIPLLQTLGLTYGAAYFGALAVFFLAGAAGTGVLARLIFRDDTAAYAAFLLLLFSSQATLMLTQPTLAVLYPPGVWFFVFLLAFLRAPRRSTALGLTYSLMLVLTTYLPFYFLTIALVLAIAGAPLFAHTVPAAAGRVTAFIRERKFFCALCALLILLSCLPGASWLVASGKGDYIAPDRQRGTEGTNVAAVTEDVAEMDCAGALLGPADLTGCRDDPAPGMLYLPVAALVFLAAGAGLRLDRRSALLAISATALFLITLGELTPVYPFLFRHVFYFRYFRNPHFFIWTGLLPLVILLAAGQWRRWREETVRPGFPRGPAAAYLAAVLLAAGALIIRTGGPDAAALASLGLGLIVLVAALWRGSAIPDGTLYGFLLVLILVQPVTVYARMLAGAPRASGPAPHGIRTSDEFSYTRPAAGGEERRFSAFTDASGFDAEIFRGMKGAYRLYRNFDRAALAGYVRHKFALYDRVVSWDEDAADYPRLRRALRERENLAFVCGGDEAVKAPEGPVPGHAEYIDGPDARLTVKNFHPTLLTLRANFAARKFLVYNDGYARGWEARLDGRPAPVLRANLAFKGVWVPAGEHELVFRYRPGWPAAAYGVMLILFCGVPAAGLVLWRRERGGRP